MDWEEPSYEKNAGWGQAILAVILTKIAASLYDEVTKRIKIAAIRNLPNQWLMTWIAEHDKDPKIRVMAVHKITRAKVLRSLLRKEKHAKVRAALLDRLPPNAVALEYKLAKTRKMRQEIAEHIYAQEYIERVLWMEHDTTLALKLVQRISAPGILSKLKKHHLREIRLWVESRLPKIIARDEEFRKNPKVLLDAVLGQTRLDAHAQRLLSWVTQPSMWYQIATTHKVPEIRLFALKSLENQQPILVRIVMDEALPTALRLTALVMVRDLTLIRHMADSKSAELRAQAIAKLDPIADETRLNKILSSDTDSNVLSAAILISKNIAALRQLVARLTNDPKMRGVLLIAQRRLKILTRGKDGNGNRG